MDDIVENYYAFTIRREKDNFERYPQQMRPILEIICASFTFNGETVIGKTLALQNPKAADFFFRFQKLKLKKIKDALHDYREYINVADGLGDTCLHYAVRREDRDVDIVLELLKNGANANKINKRFETPLHVIAYYRGAFEITRALLQYGGNPNVQNCNGDTPLHIATRDSQCSEIVKVLLEYGAKVEIINCIYRNALHTSVEGNYCDLNLIKKLLEKQPTLINSCELKNFTPLHLALVECQNKIPVIKEFLTYGADVNARDLAGRTPLHWLQNCYDEIEFDIVKAFIQKGADVNAKDVLDRTPLFCAVRQRSLATVKLLLLHGALVDCFDMMGKSILNEAVNGFELGEIVKSFSSAELELFKSEILKAFDSLKVFTPVTNSFYRHTTLIQLLNLKSNGGYLRINNDRQMEIIKLLLEYGGNPDFGNLEYRLLPFDSQSPCADKLLVQYRVLKNFDKALSSKNHESSLLANVQAMTTFNIQLFHDTFPEDWLRYRDACIFEVLKMRTDMLDNYTSLYQFIAERCSTPQAVSYTSLSVIDNFLLKLHSYEYPCCKDILMIAIKQSDVLNRLLQIHIYTKKYNLKLNSWETVFLNVHTVSHLIKYMSKVDLINFATAYLLESQPIESIPSFMNKRKLDSKSDYLMSLKCLKSDQPSI